LFFDRKFVTLIIYFKHNGDEPSQYYSIIGAETCSHTDKYIKKQPILIVFWP